MQANDRPDMNRPCAAHMPFLVSLRRCGVACLAIIFFCGCHANGELTMETALSRGKARELIRLYESRLLTDPDFLPYKMNLAVMYALSCRLDHDLGPEDITTRRSKAIQLAREAFDAELAETQPNLEALLHSGSTLAQVYAVLGSTNEMKGVFGELTKALADNKEALERITHGMDLLENRLEHSYPLDATNPFKDP